MTCTEPELLQKNTFFTYMGIKYDIVGPANQTGCITLRVGNLAD
jgi:hypothetical protein